jgi:hypothetical protein
MGRVSLMEQPTIRECRYCNRTFGDSYTALVCICERPLPTERKPRSSLVSRFRRQTVAERHASNLAKAHYRARDRFRDGQLAKAAGVG